MSTNPTQPLTRAQGSPGGLASGAALMVLFKLLDRLIGMVSLMILARLLAPSDFGLMAMSVSVMALIELLSAFGFDTALIQRQDAQRRHFDTAWTFQVIFGIATAALLLAVAVPAASFYNEPRIRWILPALALTAVIGGFGNIGTVLFRKNMDFAREFRFMLFNRILGFFVTVTMALIFRSFWALVVGMIAGKSIQVVMSYVMHPYRPQLCLQARHELFGFSKWLLLSSVLGYLQGMADKIILGRTIGPEQLGLYNMAYEIANLPSTAVIAPVNRAAYPAYSALNQDISALRATFLRTFGVIAIIAFGTSAILAAVAEPVVHVLLGAKWVESASYLRWFVLCGLVSALQSNLYVMLLAIGRPAINTRIQAIVTAIYLPSVIVLSNIYGIQGAMLALVGSAVLGLIPLHVNFFRESGVQAQKYFSTLFRPSAASISGAAAAMWSLSLIPYENSTQSAILQLTVGGFSGLLTYALTLASLWIAFSRSPTAAEPRLWNKTVKLSLRLLRFRQFLHS